MLSTCGWVPSQAMAALSGRKALPVAGETRMSGSMSLSVSLTSRLNPLKTERVMMSAAVPVAMPATLMPEMMLMTLWDFRANR